MLRSMESGSAVSLIYVDTSKGGRTGYVVEFGDSAGPW
jgi:hypothetical protein